MSSKATDINTATAIGKVITRSHAIENLLRIHYNTTGRGLHKAIDDLDAALPAILARAIRVIASVRNTAAHPDPDKFTHKTVPQDFDRLCDEIEALIPYFSGKQASGKVSKPAADVIAETTSNTPANLPSNHGKPWTPEEDKQLLSRFQAKLSIEQIAKRHKRGIGGIQSRLAKHGKIVSNDAAHQQTTKAEQDGGGQPATRSEFE